MSDLRQKVQTALDENRILVLGTQVLLGFQLRAFFEVKFDSLSVPYRTLMLLAVVALTLVLSLLLLPTAYHRIVDRGDDTRHFLQLVGSEMRFALPLLIGAVAIQLCVAAAFVVPMKEAILIGSVLGLGAWCYLGSLEWRGRQKEVQMPPMMKTDTAKKVQHVLTETRVVLPGALALLGFQFATVFMEGFDRVPASSRLIHLVSLCFLAISTLLLLAPAARHRIVERGEETEGFQNYAGRMLIAALIPLGLGCMGDLFVVARKVIGSLSLALWLTGAMSLFVFGLWFGYTLWRRRRHAHRAWREAHARK